MNAQPHTHTLTVRDHGSFWSITYGDQCLTPTKPSSFGFIDKILLGSFLEGWTDEQVLAHNIRKVIRRHDKASRNTGAGSELIKQLTAAHQPANPAEWGSEQPVNNAVH